jgi:hypothetical protein
VARGRHRASPFDAQMRLLALSPESSASTTPSEIDWTRLSPQAAWIVTYLALPMSCGLSLSEVAGQVGETPAWVQKRLKSLRAELERLSV